ncbi:MAG: hypothetical protein HYX92_11505 [Chloroflexi bacterium]|nr:hypothetical protein [Chloroflexota bacterium]
MRFLVLVNPKHPVPPEVAVGMSDGVLAWNNKFKESGKLESAWGFAGQMGGMCVLKVDSIEELNAALVSFPPVPFSDVQVIALVDVAEHTKQVKQVALSMVPPGGKR